MDVTMTHYGPWAYQQQMQLENPFYQYAINDLQAYYSSSEHQEEENDHTGDEIPSETSGDQSPNGDMFRLAFAASQWSKLVLNAEGLFNKLMTNSALQPEEQYMLKNQIEQWLCMKQEYEDCIGGDDSGSLQGYTENTRRSLERIEEVTETDEKTDESNNWMKLELGTKSCSGSDSEVIDEDEDQSDTGSESSYFLDKLDEYMKKFKMETDEIIDSKQNCLTELKESFPQLKENMTAFVPIVKPIPIRNPGSRRTSILPHSVMSNQILEFQKQQNNSMIQQDNCDLNSLNYMNLIEPEEMLQEDFDKACKNIALKTPVSIGDKEHIDILRMLKINDDEKQTQVKKIQSDLDLAYKQVEELQNTIKVKEQFIDDMLQNTDMRNSAKQKFQKKRNKIEEKYRNTEKLLNYKRLNKNVGNESAHKKEIEKYENLLKHYEKKLKDTKVIKQVAGNSAKTVVYLQNSLCESRKQMEALKQQLKKEEEQKQSLEKELIANRKRMKDLEERYDLTASKLKEVLSETEDDRNSKLRINFNEKINSTIKHTETLTQAGDLLMEQLDVEKTGDCDQKDTLRQEIRNLRHIRDRLIDVKCKFTSDRVPPMVENQRQLLLISEYVETIDAMIEQKNVMICNKGDPKSCKLNLNDEQMPIMNRLENLSNDELVTLFYKYFYKVIDLKDSSKSLEIQCATLEETLKRQKMESDTNVFRLHKYYEHRLNLVFNYYAEETSSSSYENKIDKNRDFERLIKENQVLRKRLAHFDSLLKTPSQAPAVRSHSIKSTKPMLKPELMQIALPPKTTKVTRQGNKLIFLTSEKKK